MKEEIRKTLGCLEMEIEMLLASRKEYDFTSDELLEYFHDLTVAKWLEDLL